ncbi:hypothetical protein EXIGLDRAFT_769446 [Exidia glandulosa HHB12029]|uniref:Uncharacterized protein n=1 Tax=Exidia glandulosa HHB12029 TaxID=1314781 RepID=A0A165HGS3_EXIGL|nr:hypothetical protein EXIGLDRAFT_769446 [Exidia glandulosa HHB12029]
MDNHQDQAGQFPPNEESPEEVRLYEPFQFEEIDRGDDDPPGEAKSQISYGIDGDAQARESTSCIDEVGSEPASPPSKVHGITLPSPSKSVQNGSHSGNGDAVDNWQAPRGPISAEEAWKWKAAIGRLVKGKARLTPEVLGEVAAAIGEIEARNATPGAFAQDILEDGLMQAVKMLAEAQDNVYSLEGSRTRARALVDGWKWAIRR